MLYTLQHLSYRKTAKEIVGAAISKVASLKSKIEERKLRIEAIRKEFDIDDKALIELLTAARKQSQAMSFSYSTSTSMSNATVGNKGRMEEKQIAAGVVNNLMTEQDTIEGEKDQVKKLELVIRNLQEFPNYQNGVELPTTGFPMTEEDLEYLGF